MTEKNRPRLIMIAAILALVLTFSGCGKKGDPIPPKEPLSGTTSDYRVAALNHR